MIIGIISNEARIARPLASLWLPDGRDGAAAPAAQIMGHDSLDMTMIYVQGTKQDLQQEVEKIAWA